MVVFSAGRFRERDIRVNGRVRRKKRVFVHRKKRLCYARDGSDIWVGARWWNSTPTTIKKYANRHLYNTASSMYVTLADLAKMVKNGEDFVVFDAKTNEDITRSVLTQIILEQEGIEGQSLLPTTFLRQLIRSTVIVCKHCSLAIWNFLLINSREKSRRLVRRQIGYSVPALLVQTRSMSFTRLTQQNLAAFHQALGVFSPFTSAVAVEKSRSLEDTSSEGIDKLRSQLSEMQRKLEALAKKG